MHAEQVPIYDPPIVLTSEECIHNKPTILGIVFELTIEECIPKTINDIALILTRLHALQTTIYGIVKTCSNLTNFVDYVS